MPLDTSDENMIRQLAQHVAIGGTRRVLGKPLPVCTTSWATYTKRNAQWETLSCKTYARSRTPALCDGAYLFECCQPRVLELACSRIIIHKRCTDAEDCQHLAELGGAKRLNGAFDHARHARGNSLLCHRHSHGGSGRSACAGPTTPCQSRACVA